VHPLTLQFTPLSTLPIWLGSDYEI